VGDFYVEDGCCLACGVPEDSAPDLFTSDPDHHCYVQRQPHGPEDLARMMKVFSYQDLDCIRYAGEDPTIMRALRRNGIASACDHPGPAELCSIFLTRVGQRARRLFRLFRRGV
jgi:hypothetical protein